MLPLLLQGGAAQVQQNATLAITVIPLLILYLGIIAWLTYDASQDSNWVVWLLLFLLAGPVTIPFYIFASLIARRGTSQDRLDELAADKRHAASAFKFTSDLDKMKWAEASLQRGHGTVFEPTLGLSLRQDRHEAVLDERAEQLLDAGDDAGAFEYLTGMYDIAREQGDVQRAAGYQRLIEARLPHGDLRFAHWQRHGVDLPLEEIPQDPRPTQIEPPGPPRMS